MRIEIQGKSTGVGAHADGFIIGHEPDRTESSKTGNHWTRIYKDVPENAIEIEYGHSARGAPYRSAIHCDGSSLTAEEMKQVSAMKIWQEHEE